MENNQGSGAEGIDYINVTTRRADGSTYVSKLPIRPAEQKNKTVEAVVEREKQVTVEESHKDGSTVVDAISNASKNGGRSIVEVGCGNNLSISLKGVDSWIGVDPSLGSEVNTVSRGGNIVYSESTRVLYKGYVGDLPECDPDLVLIVAPNPADIVDRRILDDVRERLMKGKASLLLVCDTQSYESAFNVRTLKADYSGLEDMKNVVLDTFGSNFEVTFENWSEDQIDPQEMKELVGIQRPLKINSNFLQGQEKLIITVRSRLNT